MMVEPSFDELKEHLTIAIKTLGQDVHHLVPEAVSNAEPTSNELEEYFKRVTQALNDDDALICLPSSTLQYALKGNPTPLAFIRDQIKNRISSWTHVGDYNDDYPYYGFLGDVKNFGELPGGTMPALSLILNNVDRNLRMMHQCNPSKLEPNARKFDKAALAIIVFHHKNEIASKRSWDPTRWIKDFYFCREGYLEGFWRSEMDRKERICIDYGDEYEDVVSIDCPQFFPLTLRFMKTVQDKVVNKMVVEKIAGHRLPPELVEMIWDVSYDNEFLESAPGLAAEEDIDEEDESYDDEEGDSEEGGSGEEGGSSSDEADD